MMISRRPTRFLVYSPPPCYWFRLIRLTRLLFLSFCFSSDDLFFFSKWKFVGHVTPQVPPLWWDSIDVICIIHDSFSELSAGNRSREYVIAGLGDCFAFSIFFFFVNLRVDEQVHLCKLLRAVRRLRLNFLEGLHTLIVIRFECQRKLREVLETRKFFWILNFLKKKKN